MRGWCEQRDLCHGVLGELGQDAGDDEGQDGSQVGGDEGCIMYRIIESISYQIC